MKYLSDYTEQAQTELFKSLGAFFAFSKNQFNEGCEKVGANENNKIASFGAGGYVLSKNLDLLIEGLNKIHDLGIKKDLEENGVNKIIMRELANHEAQITGDITETFQALQGYNITKAEIENVYKNVFFSLCIKNDWF
ncbi:MAG TPA: hypothetical protein VLZ75_02935 [Chitinophagales bacterium]|nr:hypothetical protein [Chitinophagales bacterium]